jgi:pimeloyl-ACP methyl ester carboxylesterase
MNVEAWATGEVEGNGARLHYRRSGGSGRVVVMAHGVTDAGLCFTPVAERLAGRFDVILYDARGHGRSSLPDGADHGGELARDMAGLIRALELDRPIVIGHSMGANTAAQTAAIERDAIGALVLEDPPWFSRGESGEPAPPRRDFRAWMTALKSLSLDELVAQSRRDNPGWPEAEHRPWAESKLQFNPAFLSGGLSLGDPRTYVSNIRCPTLLIHGDDRSRGAIVSARAAEEAVGMSPAIRAVGIAGAGHNIRRDRFDAYMKAVETFLVKV